METGFLNFHDEEHFSICQQGSGFDNDSSLLGANDYIDSYTVPWDHKFNVNVSKIKVEPNCKEDYEKTFNAWNQHLKELDKSIKCEGGLFLPGIDDPVCYSAPDSASSPTRHHGDEHITVFHHHSAFIKTGSEDVILSQVSEGSGGRSLGPPTPAPDPRPRQQKPALEAGDLKTLLEQFEAASEPTTTTPSPPNKSPNKRLKRPSASSTMVHKSIKEALPKELIDRIRESCKRRKEANSSGDSVVRADETPPSPVEREAECGKLLRLEHNYCSRERERSAGGAECRLPAADPLAASADPSRKDSGLESGELTDSSSLGSPSLPTPRVKQETEEADEEGVNKKKKKLKLEEYRERRKKMKAPETVLPSSQAQSTQTQQVVIKTEPNEDKGASRSGEEERNGSRPPAPAPASTTLLTAPTPPPASTTLLTAPTTPPVSDGGGGGGGRPAMVSVQVQTVEVQVKKEEKPVDEELKRKKEMWLETMRSTYRPRYSSSSGSSSYDSKTWSRRRAKTTCRRYRRRRSDSSYSRSRSRSRSRSGSGSRSRARSRSSSSSSSSSTSSEYSSGKSRSKSNRRRRSFSRNRSRKYSNVRGRRGGREEYSCAGGVFDKQRQVEERRVVYVGQIEEGISKQRLRDRFHKFGYIQDISLHFRERGDNYGFVTFKYAEDAYQAVEHGNDYGLEPKYDICFGGRRAFCKQRYSDLDSVGSVQGHYGSMQCANPVRSSNNGANSFDLLLREAQENLRKRSAV